MNKTPIYTINVSCNEITAKNHLWNKFDYEVIDAMYKSSDENKHPIVYNFLYKFVQNIQKDKVIVTFSPDPSISASTIAGMAEKYMYCEMTGKKNEETLKYKSSLKVIYLTSSPHVLVKYKNVTIENLRNSVISNLLCMKYPSFTGHKLALDVSQFILVGINDNLLEDDEREVITNQDITYFTLTQIRKKGIHNIMAAINEKIEDSPVIVIYDMSVTSYETAPCVSRFLKDGIKTNPTFLNGLDFNELKQIFENINKTNVVALDITSFDFRLDSKERAYRISCEAAKIPLVSLLEIKEKKINIFNEHSRFIIYRPMEQTSMTDVGWYILKGISLELREEVMKSIDDDTIITLDIDLNGDGNIETILLTTTTMSEQENKVFRTNDDTTVNVKIIDCVLYPVEKTSMMFELLNTNENDVIM